jgi:hypothetical protein
MRNLTRRGWWDGLSIGDKGQMLTSVQDNNVVPERLADNMDPDWLVRGSTVPNPAYSTQSTPIYLIGTELEAFLQDLLRQGPDEVWGAHRDTTTSPDG